MWETQIETVDLIHQWAGDTGDIDINTSNKIIKIKYKPHGNDC